MRTLAFAAMFTALCLPAHAQGWDGFMGLSPSDVGPAMAAEQARLDQEAAQRAADHAWGLRYGTIIAPRYPERCTIEEVARHMGVTLSADIPLPEVRYQSQLEPYEFELAFAQEFGQKARAPKSVQNFYLPKANTIFLRDGRWANLTTTLDEALAREAAYYVYYRYQGGKAASTEDVALFAGRADEAQRWFASRFADRSPCQAAQ